MKNHTTTLCVIAGILIAWGPATRPAGAGPTKLETEGSLVSLPAGKSRRVGVKNREGTVWLAVPSARSSIARGVFHRLRVLPSGTYVKLSGVLLSTDPLRMGPEDIKSAKFSEVLTLDVADDGKTAMWAGAQRVRIHPHSSILNNAGEAPTKTGLLDAIKGRRVVGKQFTFHDRAGLPTDVFLDTVQATVLNGSPLVSYADQKTGERRVLEALPLNAKVWVDRIEGDYARVRYEVRTSAGSSSSSGGFVKRSDLRFGLPKPEVKAGADRQGAAKNLDQLGE